ncbi:MAG TPA: hypothetical protein PKL26_05795 [Methanolinea sp.]|nr:hypothetical protein [Methanolinea sp.]
MNSYKYSRSRLSFTMVGMGFRNKAGCRGGRFAWGEENSRIELEDAGRGART